MGAVVAAAEPSTGPTVRRIMVGTRLRQLREAAGVTREEAGYLIRGSASKISRLELGKVGFKERDLSDLLTHYGVSDDTERDALLTLARDANNPGWWQVYDEVTPSWFQNYLGLEEAASTLRVHETQVVPGLLQTEEYARALMSSSIPPVRDADIDGVVNLRLERQQLLTKSPPLALWVVIDEAVFHRPTGGRAVMRRQIEHLLRLSELPTVTIQLLPLRFGGHVTRGGAFNILRFTEPELPDLVYLEQLAGGLYLDKPEQVVRYSVVMEGLAVSGLPPEQTTATLHNFLERG